MQQCKERKKNDLFMESKEKRKTFFNLLLVNENSSDSENIETECISKTGKIHRLKWKNKCSSLFKRETFNKYK